MATPSSSSSGSMENDALSYDGQTAFEAAANGDFPLVVLLWGMAMAAQPQPVDLLLPAKDKSGNSLVHCAAASGHDTTDTMHFLMQQMAASGREEALVDAKNSAGETPLIRAAHAGNLRIVDTLLQSRHVDLLARDARGNTAAHHAAARGHLWVLHFLLETEQQRKDGSFPTQDERQEKGTMTRLGGYSLQYRNVLHYACMSEYKPMVQYLLTRGFDVEEVDAEGKKCLDVAKQRDLVWLEDILAVKASATDPPTHMRKTRGIVAVLHGALLFAVLATSYWLVWWLAAPLIFIGSCASLAAFRPSGHSHGGHSHGGHAHGVASTTSTDTHASEQNVVMTMDVSLKRIEEGPMYAVSRRGSKDKTKVTLRTLTRAQPESAMGIWMAWVSLFTLMYIVLWVDPTYEDFMNSHVPFLGVTGAMEVVFLVVWAKVAFLCPIDPGRIATYEHDVRAMLDMASQAETPDADKFCRTCLVAKPIRSKHCAQCGICIARHDHHCTWLNRCVGYGNHRSFIAFLLLHCIMLGIYVVLAILVLSGETHNLHAKREGADRSSRYDVLSAMDVWVEIPSLVSKHLLVVLVLMWSCMAFAALAVMTAQQLNNIGENITINERVNWRRYAYMMQGSAGAPQHSEHSKPTTNGRMSNPFDRGLKTNIMEFFLHASGSAVNYHKVFRPPGRDYDITSPVSCTSEGFDMSIGDRERRESDGFV